MKIIHSRKLSGNIWLSLLALLITACTQVTPPERPAPDNSAAKLISRPTLELLTLNIAHGRKDSFNQLLVPNDTIVENLDDIAEMLKKVDADIVALQEADGPSAWSGYFNHVSYLANMAEYPWDIYSAHVNGKRINYGTALLSKVPFKDTLSHDFPKSPPTLRKGFTLGEIEWQPDENKPAITVDVLSVHLDFSRKAVRRNQLGKIIEAIQATEEALIIMGDFNEEWDNEESVVQALVNEAGMQAFQPESGDHASYKDKRLDWILISEQLEFTGHRVITEEVSDHRLVVAEVRWREEQ